MRSYAGTCPLTQTQLIDEYFMEHRTKVLDIAALLDRMDRSIERNAADDFRIVAFREALSALCTANSDRVERVQMIFSDPTTEPLEQLDSKSAFGAFGRASGEER